MVYGYDDCSHKGNNLKEDKEDVTEEGEETPEFINDPVDQSSSSSAHELV